MSSDSGSDAPVPSRRNGNRDANDDVDSDLDEDLFGGEEEDEDAEPANKAKIRTLDDSDLDSGDDEGREDRAGSQEEVIQVQRDEVVQPMKLPRHVVPEPDDNELYLVKVPKFLAIQPHSYNLQSFQPPTTDHHSKTTPSESFDAYETAITTIRWRHSPSDLAELQSNARILRWSDGSMTLQMATNSTEQHEIRANAMAPPQVNPPKPTAISAVNKGRRRQHYNSQDEQFTYLASANRTAYGVRLTNKFTANATILPSAKRDTMEDIEASMQAIQAKYKAEQEHVGLKITNEIIDPEKLKQEALKQEREAERRIRKAERDGEKQLKFGRAGRGGGLTIDDLEGSGRPRQPRGPKNPRRARRDSLSDEEEEMYGRRGGSQDIYDLEDDFLVGSEEDVEGSDEDAEGEEDIDAVIERNERLQRHVSPKRARPEEEDKSHASPVSRHKRRRVVSDDEDE